jgi:hypothetical protein
MKVNICGLCDTYSKEAGNFIIKNGEHKINYLINNELINRYSVVAVHKETKV